MKYTVRTVTDIVAIDASKSTLEGTATSFIWETTFNTMKEAETAMGYIKRHARHSLVEIIEVEDDKGGKNE
jgi:hypothetical protein